MNGNIAESSSLVPEQVECINKATKKEAVIDSKMFACYTCCYSTNTLKGLKAHVSRMHKTLNEDISGKNRQVGDSIPQTDVHSEQKLDGSMVEKEIENQTEEVKNNCLVLQDWDEDLIKDPERQDMAYLHEALSEPPPTVLHPVHGIGVYEYTDRVGGFAYKFSDGRSRQ